MHRSLCVYSFDHRGTPERPGLVLGLDFGGACRGIAYRVARKHRAATLAYLRDREQTTAVYREMVRGVWLEGQPERRVEALCYVVDRGHPQYAGRLTHDRQLHIVRQGHGRSGNNRDYVIETVKALEALNIVDHDLHVLAERLRGSQDSRGVARVILPRTSADQTDAEAIELGLALRDQPRGGRFDVVLQPREKRILVEPRRDRAAGIRRRSCRESGRKARRGQNRPEFSATGTQGTPTSA